MCFQNEKTPVAFGDQGFDLLTSGGTLHGQP